MKYLAAALLTMIILLQYPLWLGKAGWLKVRQLEQNVTAAHEQNLELQSRNTVLFAEINDLKQGTDAIEERARSDLGMIKKNEILFQIVESSPPDNSSPASIARAHSAP
ncbi:MAG TPA: cell division protein FtsB [Nitrosomonas sp.]|uniref:cell division protein FtsB n=1 Tax=Nitrosomonas sp. TaxID=42353 RepID=UPI00207EB788|nr:cell division protein FtsB [Nitrosomonas sp.]GJL75089.1 MAG: cell division protein FtsB [Nitrosomonas sp.]HNP25898.1 cell division protein FtsB [Nitrosomonas sp.]